MCVRGVWQALALEKKGDAWDAERRWDEGWANNLRDPGASPPPSLFGLLVLSFFAVGVQGPGFRGQGSGVEVEV